MPYLTDAQLQHGDAVRVLYRDAGAGVYLEWTATDPYILHVLSADLTRVLGYFAGASGTATSAHESIVRHINTPGKPYGEWVAPEKLWDAG